jgi:hypothetical protein
MTRVAPEKVAALHAMLVERKLANADAPPAELARERPWFVSLLLGAAGWLAGLFALVLLAGMLEPQEKGFIIYGLLLQVAAFFLYSAATDSPFFDQLALMASIAGQLSFAFGVGDATDSPTATGASLLVLQVLILLVMPSQLARTLAALFAAVAWAVTLRLAILGESMFSSRATVGLGTMLVLWFVVWLPVIVLLYTLVRRETRWMASAMRERGRATVIGLAIAAALGQPLTAQWDYGGGLNATAYATDWLWPLLGVGVAACVGYWAFQLRSRALLGVAIVGALGHLSHFYYLLGTTLLQKSFAMLLLGGLLIALGRRLRKGVAAEAPP